MLSEKHSTNYRGGLTPTLKEVIKINSKKVLTIIITAVFLVTVFAFSLNAAENEFNLNELENPSSIQELLAMFSEFGFTMTEKESGELIREFKITITNQGKEKVDGIETDKVIIEGSGTERLPLTKIWLDGEEVKKLIIDNQELPPAMAQNFADGILRSALAPFMYFQQYDLEDTEDFKSADIKTRTRVLGGKEVEISEYDMQNPEAYELKSGVISIAEFEDFLLLENYKVTTIEDIEIDYRVDKIEF